MIEPISPIFVTDLFPEMHFELFNGLESLAPDQWKLPTACAGWSVKDVAQHLLADQCGYLSGSRDHEGVWFDTNSWDELIDLINEQNERWVKATRRLSRALLISLLRFTGDQFDVYIRTIDLDSESVAVSWIGPESQPAWMHLAREYTEYWMHHQHIFEAVGIESLKSRRFMLPLLTTFAHSLQRAYRDVPAPQDTLVLLRFTGEAASEFHLIREADRWRLVASSDRSPAATVIMPDDTAWRLFTKGISPEVPNHGA